LTFSPFASQDAHFPNIRYKNVSFQEPYISTLMYQQTIPVVSLSLCCARCSKEPLCWPKRPTYPQTCPAYFQKRPISSLKSLHARQRTTGMSVSAKELYISSTALYLCKRAFVFAKQHEGCAYLQKSCTNPQNSPLPGAKKKRDDRLRTETGEELLYAEFAPGASIS